MPFIDVLLRWDLESICQGDARLAFIPEKPVVLGRLPGLRPVQIVRGNTLYIQRVGGNRAKVATVTIAAFTNA